jgi:hypothetical protein
MHGSTPDDNMKQFIVSHAWTRVRLPLPDNQPFVELDVVYNLGHGDTAHIGNPCVIDFGKRAAENVSACSAMSTASSVTLAPSLMYGECDVGRQDLCIQLLTVFRTSTLEPPITSASTTTSAPPPATPTSTITPSPINSRPTSVPSPIPSSDQCRIKVVEFDDPNPSNHSAEVWSVSIFPVTANALTNNTQICFHGTDANEQTGVNVKCPPIGEDDEGFVNVRREGGDRLRFIWGSKTWTAEDNQCKLLQGWHQSDIDKKERKRETECVFDCTIDWTQPPSLVLD